MYANIALAVLTIILKFINVVIGKKTDDGEWVKKVTELVQSLQKTVSDNAAKRNRIKKIDDDLNLP